MDNNEFNQKLELISIYARNFVFYFGGSKQFPKSVNLLGKSTVIDASHWDIAKVFSKTSVKEIFALYLLDNLKLSVGGTATTIREALSTNMELGKNGAIEAAKIGDTWYSVLHKAAMDVWQQLPLNTVQSKTHVGIQGNTFFANWKEIDINEMTSAAIDMIFGKDQMGRWITAKLGNSRCTNLLDMLYPEDMVKLLQLIENTPFGVTSLHNYFAARGMTYINQEVFLRRGISCGMAEGSYVVPIMTMMPNPQVRLEAAKMSELTNGRDLVVLSAAKGILLYFTAPRLESFLVASDYLRELSKGGKAGIDNRKLEQLVSEHNGVIFRF